MPTRTPSGIQPERTPSVRFNGSSMQLSYKLATALAVVLVGLGGWQLTAFLYHILTPGHGVMVERVKHIETTVNANSATLARIESHLLAKMGS